MEVASEETTFQEANKTRDKMTDYETIAISKKQYLDTEMNIYTNLLLKRQRRLERKPSCKKYGKVKYTTTTYNDR